jgi:hypothetical protein
MTARNAQAVERTQFIDVEQHFLDSLVEFAQAIEASK